MLKLIAEDPAIAAKRGVQARRLWAACGLPDFRKVGPMHHARMVRRMFSYTGDGGHIPHEWFAAEVARLDNVSGDIEALADRLAGVRSWAYIAHRADWLADPAKWAERTREVEARLSDALHERLTQRFVDRRTAVLVRDIGARGADALPVTVAADGEVSVGPEPIGHLAGFDFRVDPNARLADKRLLLAAAERRLGDELERRANALVDAADDAFTLTVDDNGGVAIGWEGNRARPPRARPVAARAGAAHRPRARPPLRRHPRQACGPGSKRWLEAQIAQHLAPLRNARRRRRPTAPARPASARSARCSADAGGTLPRKAVVGAIGHLEQVDRQTLHRLRVRLGPLDVYLPPLLKPAAQFWRGALHAVRTGQPMPKLPPAGAAMLAPDADLRGAELAYRRLGRRWIRIDLADRLASHAHKARAAGGGDPVDAAFATSVGLDQAAVATLMDDIGFAQKGGSWTWRGKRRSDAATGPRAPTTPSPNWPSSSGARARRLRIDRFLHCIRLVKSRTLAQSVIDSGYVRIDGKRVEKPSDTVKVGSVIALPLRDRIRILRVLALPAAPRPAGGSQGLLRRTGR